MHRTLMAAWIVVVIAAPVSALAQGKSLAGQNSTQMGTPFQQLQAQVSALELQVQTMRQQMLALHAQIGQVESWLQAQIRTINETLADLQAQITDGVETTASLATRMAANEAAIEALTRAIGALEAQVAAAEALLASNAGDVAALQGHIASLQSLITAHSSHLTALQQQTASLLQFQTNLANGTCVTGSAIQDIASNGFIACMQAGGGALQTLTRTVTTGLFTGTNVLAVACPAGYVATGSGFTVPAVVETQSYVASVHFATMSVTNGSRSFTPITVSQSITNATSATVQVQYLPQTYYSGYFFQAQVTCARTQ